MATKQNSTTSPPLPRRVRVELYLAESDLALIEQHRAAMQAHIDAHPYGDPPWKLVDSVRAMFFTGIATERQRLEGGK